MALASREEQGGPRTAVRLLGEAFEVLDQAVDSGNDDWDGLGMACTAAAGLLPIVEQVDARLLPEFLWRTLALRPPIPGPMDSRLDLPTSPLPTWRSMAARYDRGSGPPGPLTDSPTGPWPVSLVSRIGDRCSVEKRSSRRRPSSTRRGPPR